MELGPVCWEETPEFYGFSGHDDPHYPKDGVCEILRNNKDIEEVLTDEGEWEAFQMFMAEFKRVIFTSLLRIMKRIPEGSVRRSMVDI